MENEGGDKKTHQDAKRQDTLRHDENINDRQRRRVIQRSKKRTGGDGAGKPFPCGNLSRQKRK